MNEPIGRLWTQALSDELIRQINADAKTKKLAAKLEATIQLRCLDTPDGTDVAVRYALQKGAARMVEWTEEPAPAAFRHDRFDKHNLLARTTAPYNVWVKLDKGEMGVIDAILSPLYKFEGAKLKVLKNVRVFQRINELSQAVSKTY